MRAKGDLSLRGSHPGRPWYGGGRAVRSGHRRRLRVRVTVPDGPRCQRGEVMDTVGILFDSSSVMGFVVWKALLQGND